jgi:hypothetical protein
MKNRAFFSTMSAEQLRVVNGGGFAYDIGRFIRFLVKSGGGATFTNAYMDYVTNDIINEAINP